MKHSISICDLIRLQHQSYDEDIPFWVSRTNHASLVLELGCGHGRVTVPLAKEGRSVIGIDKDWSALSYLGSIIASRGSDLRKRIQIIQADMLNFQCASVFDAVILPCNTFSTFNQPDRFRILEGVARSLLPGGSFIASIPNPAGRGTLSLPLTEDMEESMAEIETQFVHPEYGFPVQVSSKLSPSDGGILLEWIYDLLMPDGAVERYIKSTEHFLEPMEVYLSELHRVGITVEACLGDYIGDEYDQDSPYLILIGTLP